MRKPGNEEQPVQEEVAPGDEEVIVGETGEGEGPPIVLQKVMIQDLNQEFLMDEQGNLYDMEGHYVGKVDEGAEEGEEDPNNEGMYYGEEEGNDGNGAASQEPAQAHGGKNALPEIPPFNPKGKKGGAGDAGKKKPMM